MQLFYQPIINPESEFILPEDEAKHFLKVLRMQIGDILHLTDGKGNLAAASIMADNPKKCKLQIKNITKIEKPYTHYTHIAIAPTKNADRIEWFVEKCVEIGIDEISFLQTEHTERNYFNVERIEKKAIAAMKQSLKFYLPVINPPVNLSSFFKKKHLLAQSASNFGHENLKREFFIAYMSKIKPKTLFQAASKNANVCVLIGPEGDFSANEVAEAFQFGYQGVSLGNSRLRTETAGVAACHALQLLNE
jgi:16S rRNA (uracil1498-N3)-methyltransferase